MRYLIEFSYKGTHYRGWQRQNNALTVQEVLENAFETILRQSVEITGSSRTDAGVHAVQQFAHFDFTDIEHVEGLIGRLNSILPADIGVSRILPVKDDFNSRFEATYRRYEYHITRTKDPFGSETSYFFKPALDVDLMNRAAGFLLRHTDFECFSKVKTNVFTFNCTVTKAIWTQRGSRLVFDIRSNRFLRGMVRAIVGTLLQVGLGRLSLDEFEAILKSKDRKKAGAQAPAQGLFLMEVGYEQSALLP